MNFSHIKILHLSDLHFGTVENANLWFSQLSEDLKNDQDCKSLDIVVLSGDITNQSTLEQFKAAKIFLDKFSKEFNLSKEQFVIVPGNHDLSWDSSKNAYEIKELDREPEQGYFIPTKEENVYRVCDKEKYKTRFQSFKIFYYEITGSDYPIDYEQQYTINFYKEKKLLILGLNSAWHLDHHYKERVSINNNALNNALDYIRVNYPNCMKICTFHHPLNNDGEDRIKDHAFMERLAVAGFTLILHGHIHTAKNSLYKYDQSIKGRKIDIVSAGTFGAPTKELVPSYPWQYNLINILSNKIVINTRKREESNGAWKPDARWLQGKGKDPISRYEILLNE